MLASPFYAECIGKMFLLTLYLKSHGHRIFLSLLIFIRHASMVLLIVLLSVQWKVT